MRGSVRERGEGRWELRVSLGASGGRRLTKSKTVDAKDAAHARRQLTRYLAELGDSVPADRITVGRAVESWYEHTAARRQARSNETVRANIDRHLMPGVGDLPLARCDVATLERFYARLAADSGLGPGTVRHVHYILRPALRLAVRWGWAESNPAEQVELGPLHRPTVRPPSADDVVRLLAAADPTLLCFLRLCAVTGARRAEVAALRWADIDWLNARLSVTVALSHPKRGLELKGVKTDRGQRIIGVDFDTISSLDGQRTRNLALGAHDGPTRFVFPDLRRDAVGAMPVPPGVWSSRFFRLKKQVGVNFRLHDLRHFAATSLLTDGTPPSAVSVLLGQSRTSTTTDLYGAWAARTTNPALAEALAARLSPQPHPRDLPHPGDLSI